MALEVTIENLDLNEAAPPTGTDFKINVDDAWKDVDTIKINVDDAWKEVTAAKVNKDDSWKTIF